MCELWWVSVTDHRMVEVVLCPVAFPQASTCHADLSHSLTVTLVRDWATATSMVVLVFVRVRSGASAQLAVELSVEISFSTRLQWRLYYNASKTVSSMSSRSTGSPIRVTEYRIALRSLLP